MSKFKVGDKVICKDMSYNDFNEFSQDEWGDGFRYGNITEIKGYDGYHYYVYSSNMNRIYFCEHSLELVKPKTNNLNLPKKYDSGKPRMDLIRPEFTLALGKVLGYGAEKYQEPRGDTPNYLKGEGFQYSKILASLERHIAQFKMGVNIDEESGSHHLACAAANLMFLLTYELTGNGQDDRIILGGKDEK